MEERAKYIAELLKLLANENRLLILCALIDHSMTVGEIAKYTPNITQSALSQHLRMLKAHNILDSNKSGQRVTYSIIDHRVEMVVDVLKKQYCDTDVTL